MTVHNNSVNNIFRNQPRVSSAVDYVILDTDVIVEISDTSIARAVTLPAPSSLNSGKFFVIKDTSGAASINNITITPASGTVDGTASYLISSNYGSVVLYTNGSNYFTYSRFQDPSYLYASFSTSQTTNTSTNDHFKFDTTLLSRGDAITLDGTSPYTTALNVDSVGRFTLQAGTYEMFTHFGQIVNPLALGVLWGWYNADAGSIITPDTLSLTTTSTGQINDSVSMAIFSPSVPTRVEVRMTVISAPPINSIGSGTRLPFASIKAM